MKKYFLEIKWLLILQMIFDVLFAATNAAVPALQKLLLDIFTVKEGERHLSLLMIILLYIACIIFGAVFSYLDMYFSWKSSLKFEMLLKRDFFRSVFSYNYEEFSSRDVGEYISIQGNDITELEQDYITPIIDMFKSFCQIVVYSVFIFKFVDYRISIVIVVGTIISVFIPKLLFKSLASRRSRYLDQIGIYVSRIKDFLEGFKIINRRTRDKINHEHEKVLIETRKLRFKYGKFKTLAITVESLSINAVGMSAFIMSAILLMNHEITVGVCVAAFGYVNNFISPVDGFIYGFNLIGSLTGVKNKVLSFINNGEQEKLNVKKDFKKDIVFENVSFKYNNFDVKNLNLKFEKGKKYAVIGHNGCGKSTLINLLMKYLTIESGTIKIDGEDVRNIDTADIMYCVNQNDHIFSDNFINNATVYLSYLKKNAERIASQLNVKAINAIKSTSDCQKLSGGEKQILAIVRALSSQTKILLMDEPFAAVDVKTTETAEDYLLNICDKTIVMVTHNLNESLNRFDEIIMMKDGQVINKGTYDEISKTDEYKKLINNK